MVCFHNAGSSESVYTGKGMRAKEDNPFVVHCATNGGELMACELPGREGRRNEPRSRTLKPYCEALLPILGPLLQEDVPYVVVGHSMGTWMSYEFCRLVCEKGFPLPKMLCISGFPSPSWPEAKRPWSKNAPMADPAFQDEARGWNHMGVVFLMMRDIHGKPQDLMAHVFLDPLVTGPRLRQRHREVHQLNRREWKTHAEH